MNNSTQVYGIIIKVMPVGEYDKRITILTKELGKVSAFARGARRQGSSLMGVTRVFATGTFKLFEGRDAYSLQSASIDNYFENIVNEMDKTCYGMYFLELADYYSKDYLSDPMLIKLLYLSLVALTKPSLNTNLVRRIFELRTMVISGEYDQLPKNTDSESVIYTWNYIVKSPLDKLYTFTVTDAILSELGFCIDQMMKRLITRNLHSLEILESLN